jgi:hypothetical protein
VCARNQVILIEEDDVKYKSFKSDVETMDEFKDSKVMLCTFYGIWMAFKKDLITLLDNTPHGKLTGKQILLLVLVSVLYCTLFHVNALFLKFYVYYLLS